MSWRDWEVDGKEKISLLKKVCKVRLKRNQKPHNCSGIVVEMDVPEGQSIHEMYIEAGIVTEI